MFVCFFNDISRLFSAIFRAIAVCKFAAMLFVLTFVPAGIDEWNFPSHHSFFGLFLKEVAYKTVRALWKSCDRGLTVLCQLNMKLRRKALLGQNEKIPIGLLFAASQQAF